MSTPSRPRTANDLREAFRGYFADRGHTRVDSASLIPHDPTVLFTVAGMVPFKPYFVGDEVPPFSRAVTVQKCARAGGKHNDLDDVGRTKRHLVFFEMLGNFSFGDYFKEDAIPWSWDLVTEVFGFDGDQLWITVHESDDEAEAIWHEVERLAADTQGWNQLVDAYAASLPKFGHKEDALPLMLVGAMGLAPCVQSTNFTRTEATMSVVAMTLAQATRPGALLAVPALVLVLTLLACTFPPFASVIPWLLLSAAMPCRFPYATRRSRRSSVFIRRRAPLYLHCCRRWRA